jgi:Holliday junction resolvase RusA-like endonuclease
MPSEDVLPSEPVVRRITVHGYVTPKARARVLKNGHSYTPTATREAEFRIAQAWREAYPSVPPAAGPVALHVLVIRSRPLSHYGTGRNAGALKPGAPRWITVKPDIDNYQKVVLDALNGVAYADDGRVARLYGEKMWGEGDYWVVTVRDLGL